MSGGVQHPRYPLRDQIPSNRSHRYNERVAGIVKIRDGIGPRRRSNHKTVSAVSALQSVVTDTAVNQVAGPYLQQSGQASSPPRNASDVASYSEPMITSPPAVPTTVSKFTTSRRTDGCADASDGLSTNKLWVRSTIAESFDSLDKFKVSRPVPPSRRPSPRSPMVTVSSPSPPLRSAPPLATIRSSSGVATPPRLICTSTSREYTSPRAPRLVVAARLSPVGFAPSPSKVPTRAPILSACLARDNVGWNSDRGV